MLNGAHFLRLAGDPEIWDVEITHRIGHGETLADIQHDQWRRGRRVAELSPHEFGWCVRSGISFDGWRALSPVFVSKDDALSWGVEWVKADPFNREFITKRTHHE